MNLSIFEVMISLICTYLGKLYAYLDEIWRCLQMISYTKDKANFSMPMPSWNAPRKGRFDIEKIVLSRKGS